MNEFHTRKPSPSFLWIQTRADPFSVPSRSQRTVFFFYLCCLKNHKRSTFGKTVRLCRYFGSKCMFSNSKNPKMDIFRKRFHILLISTDHRIHARIYLHLWFMFVVNVGKKIPWTVEIYGSPGSCTFQSGISHLELSETHSRPPTPATPTIRGPQKNHSPPLFFTRAKKKTGSPVKPIYTYTP